jgi:hypothetical protein
LANSLKMHICQKLAFLKIGSTAVKVNKNEDMF